MKRTAGNPNPPPAKQDIILDTCILQYFSKKQVSKELRAYLSDLMGRGFSLSISEISTCELLSGATIKQEQEGYQTLSVFKRYLIDSRSLITAAQVATLYHKEKIPNDKISIADRIVAATAILTGSLVLTADFYDFPRPFFSEAEKKPIFYKVKNKDQMLVIYLLRPDLNIILKRFSERPKG